MPKLVKPSLVIGLGSTGCEIALKLAQRLKYGPVWLPTCQLLLLDDKPLERPSPETSTPGHRVTVYPLRLSDSPPATRAAARELCAAKAEEIIRSVTEAFSDMTAVENREALLARGYRIDTRNADIYLFVSLGGTLGSGGFLDVAYLVRDFLQRRRINHTLKGLFLLPDPFAPGDVALREAQAYAALRELDFFTERGQFAWAYSDRLSLRVNRPPFDQCFLLDTTNEEGLNLSLGPLGQVVAEIGYRMLSTAVGETLDGALEPLAVPPRYLDGKLGAYSSLGYSALTFPAQAFSRYSAFRLAAELVQQVLLAPPADREGLERAQRDVANRLNLGDDQGRDLLAAITRAASGQEEFTLPLPPSFADIPEERLVAVIDAFYGERLGLTRPAPPTPEAARPEDAAADAPSDPVEQDLRRLKAQMGLRTGGPAGATGPSPPPPTLGAIDRQADTLAARAREELDEQVRRFVDDPFRVGLRGAVEFLTHLEGRVQQVREAIRQQTETLKDRLAQSRERYEQQRAALERSIAAAPNPALFLMKTLLLCFFLIYGLGAGLEVLFQRGFLESPPFLQRMFVEQEPAQNVFLALLFLVFFTLRGVLTCEVHRSAVARERGHYVQANQDLAAIRLEAETAQSAGLFLAQVRLLLQEHRQALETGCQNLQRVARHLTSLAEKERTVLLDRPRPLEESVATRSDYEDLYRETVTDLTAEATALAQDQGPFHDWLNRSAEAQAQALVRFAQTRFQGIQAWSVEDLIRRKERDTSALARLEKLYSAASPFLRYTDVHLRGSGQVLPVEVVGLADPDRSSLIRLAETLRPSTLVARTEDPECLCLVRTKNALPLYALAMMGSYRDRYELLRTKVPLHARPEYEHLPDPMPESLLEMDPDIFRALVVGRAFGLVDLEERPEAGPSAFHLRAKSVQVERDVLLGYEPQGCVDYLHGHPPVLEALQAAIAQQISILGPEAAAAHLETYLATARLSEVAQKRLREAIERVRGKPVG